MNVTLLISAIIYGLILGIMYGGIALGLSLIYGVLRVSNFAQGSLLMVACYMFYIFQHYLNIDMLPALVIILPLMFLFGYSLQYFFIGKLLRRERASNINPISAMLFTIGIWMVLDNLFLMIFGGELKRLDGTFGNAAVMIANVSVYISQIVGVIGTLILVCGLVFLLHRTEMGKKIRSVSQNRDAAALCGIDVYRTYALTFGLAMVMITISAFFLCQYYPLVPTMGSSFSTRSIMIVVLGGLGSIPGAMLGGVLFGLIESVGGQFVTASSAGMLNFALFLLVLFIKPRGLFGKSV